MGKGYGNGEGWGEGEGRVEGKWKDGLLGSCKLSGGCCLACCCPPIGNCMIAEKIGDVGIAKYIGFLDFFGGAGIGSCVGQIMIREKIREKEGIQGSFFDDCLAACCCLECSVCQTYNHVN